jgi:hypothetical protein
MLFFFDTQLKRKYNSQDTVQKMQKFPVDPLPFLGRLLVISVFYCIVKRPVSPAMDHYFLAFLSNDLSRDSSYQPSVKR